MTKNARLSLVISALFAGGIAFWGGFTRRWMSDDGLIVLRTVRNLLAGNGPVFNVGERVEANTSTLWQYFITALAWVVPARLEDIATWLALFCTVAACVIAVVATGRFWLDTVLPFGVLIYLALPPARDFATSGLEWGLCLLWLAVWWALLVHWARRGGGGHQVATVGYWLALWCGLSWLVRPELALYGGVTGLVLLVSSPTQWWKILAAALPIPAAYQIFRMGYYGLLTPHTAVAKSAAESEWGQGFSYLWEFFSAYALWVVIPIAAVVGVALMRGSWGRERTIVLVAVVCGLVHIVYVLRVGGDFMHARMLLLPLFALLLPVMVVPLTPKIGAVVLAVAVWGGVVVLRSHPIDWEPYNTGQKPLGIVDEREFWIMALYRDPHDAPMYKEDFLTSKLMGSWQETLAEAKTANAAQMWVALISDEPEEYSWVYLPRPAQESDLENLALTTHLVNLGMTGMNADLETRVLDTVGLSTPLAARMPRDPNGRVGHDKSLPWEWKAADAGVDLNALPDWVDKQAAMQARAALRTPEIRELLASYREPMSPQRFRDNIVFSLTGGRTLQLDDDPATYLDNATLEQISRGEDVGLKGPQIAWP